MDKNEMDEMMVLEVRNGVNSIVHHIGQNLSGNGKTDALFLKKKLAFLHGSTQALLYMMAGNDTMHNSHLTPSEKEVMEFNERIKMITEKVASKENFWVSLEEAAEE